MPVLKELSFWSRKATAERLASNYDCYDAIASISEEARKHGAEGQYTVLLGHSFGGLIVERSVAHAVNAEIHGRPHPNPSFPPDLILGSIKSERRVGLIDRKASENFIPQHLATMTCWLTTSR